jgi:hypothetical protein
VQDLLNSAGSSLHQGIDGNMNDANKPTRVVLKEMFMNMKDKSV